MRKNNGKIVYYDKEEDVLSLYLKKGKEDGFVEVSPGVSVELDRKGNVMGVEILNASRVFKSFLKSASKRIPMYAR